MPRIPQINDGRQQMLGNVPAPVLDRQNRPRMDLRGVVSAAGALGDANRAVLAPDLSAPSRALQSVGAAISETGSVIGALALKQKEAVAAVKIAEADSAMDSERAKFEIWKSKNPDPTGWTAKWDEHLVTLGSKLQQVPGVSPDAAEQINLRFTRFQGQQRASVAMGAAKESFNLAASTYRAQGMRAVESQDPALLEETITQGEEKGYLYPHEAQGLRQSYTREGERQTRQADHEAYQSDQEAFATMLIADPWAAKESIKDDLLFPALDASDRITMEAQANSYIARMKAEATDIIKSGIVMGHVGEKDIDSHAKALHLDAIEEQALRNFRQDLAVAKAQNAPIDDKLVGKLRADITAFDAAGKTEEQAFKDYSALADRVEFEAMGSGDTGKETQKLLRDLLSSKHPYNDLKPRTDMPSGIQSEANRLIDLERAAGTWGQLRDDDGEINIENSRKAVDAENNIKRELENAVKANPEKFKMPGAVKDFINQKLHGTAAGSQFKSWRTPSAALFPRSAPQEDPNPDLTKELNLNN